MGNTLRGSYRAKLDKSGRIKIPEKFRTAIEKEYGKELFITSIKDGSVQIFPLPVWDELTGITTEGTLYLKPRIRNFLIRVNRLGNKHEIDTKGRVLISQPLREKANLEVEVEVIGLSNHLEVWNTDILDQTLEDKPLTEEDFERISELKPKGKPE